MVCCRYIIVNTLHKGGNKDNNNNNNNNNKCTVFQFCCSSPLLLILFSKLLRTDEVISVSIKQFTTKGYAIDLSILNLGTRWNCPVSFKPLFFLFPGKESSLSPKKKSR